jgi:predicted unusual protein kinase regulating ubiquinone biosynthesis (AarF/ABC1/UbiB family)
VQYPGIAEAIQNDFRLLRAIAGPANLSRLVSPPLLDELEQQITAEADYEKEAANTEFFRDRLKQFAGVEVPRIHRKYSTDKVLTMSWIEGEHLDSFLKSRPSQRLRDLLGERLLDLFNFQLLELGAFHADPHWGNYLLQRDGSIGLVDFGCVKQLPDKFVHNLRKMFLYPGKRDSAEFRALLDERYSVGQKLSAKTKNALVRLTEKFYGRVYPPNPETDGQTFDFSETRFLAEYMSLCSDIWRAKGALPEYLFYVRAEAGLYQTLHRLGARVHTSRIVRRYLAV